MPGPGATFSPDGSPAHRPPGSFPPAPNYSAPAAYGAPPAQAPYMAGQSAPYYTSGAPPTYATAGAPSYGQDPNAAYAPPYAAPPQGEKGELSGHITLWFIKENEIILGCL